MESIVSIQYCICLTSITGGVISIIWYLLGRLLEKAGFLNIVYTLLKVTTIFWILPVAYNEEKHIPDYVLDDIAAFIRKGSL